MKSDGSIIIGLVARDSSWGSLYEEKGKAGHPLYSNARFYRLNEIENMLQTAGLKISRINSTLRQRPDEPRRVENPAGYYVEGAGFLCIEATPE